MRKSLFTDLKEYLQLFWVNLLVKKRDFVEFVKVASHYYHNREFLKIDSSLVFAYLFNNPYTISKKFLISKGEEDIYAYGETPLTTLDYISKECRLTAKDTVFELGCGRGRTSFWLHCFLGCKVVGIEYIPDFIEIAQSIKDKYAIKNVEFHCEDILKADFQGGTVFYLYGTSFEDAFIEQLVNKFKAMPSGTKIITISYPLSESESSDFEVMKRFQAEFTWGTADVYLQIKK